MRQQPETFGHHRRPRWQGAQIRQDLLDYVDGINAYIETYERSQDTPRPNGFIETGVAVRMLSLIKNAVELRTMGLIYSDAGRGKTMTLQAAAMLFTGSIYIRVRRTTRTPE